jgi:hypothetical protein
MAARIQALQAVRASEPGLARSSAGRDQEFRDDVDRIREQSFTHDCLMLM